MTADTVITRIRRRLDQVPLNVESVDKDSDVLGSVSTNFSNEDLLDRINKATRAIISKVKAQHVPMAIEKKTSVNGIEQSAVRLLPRRVFGSDDGGTTYVRAFERSVDTQRRLESRISNPGREATAQYPVFVYEDGRFQIFPETLGVKAFVVEAPSGATSTSDTLVLDERFERAITDYVSANCYQTMRRTNLAEFFMNLYNRDLQPYSLDLRYGSLDDQEIDVE
ncbi:hypothetical protein [Salinibacter ruber]|uniref:Uncharacterized protein n=1 Tax=Salinibacter ruber TaxID=146919 RepID=A0A9X2TIS8_9BACT|nr:hypothetical protein [Salinibacter ruber]MCS3661803.1 hypothetical protein [Salinibacter ruber]MCS3711536.1 hypothetical protein [Salinibacter ruber]